MARPKKPTKKRKITATVRVLSGPDGRSRWLVSCSKHGLVSKHRYWHSAATAKYKHEAQHRE